MSFLDLTETESDSGYGPIPIGDYEAILDSAEWVLTKADDDALKVVFKIVEGNHEGRLVFMNYNLFHPNDKPREISRNQLKKTLECLGYEKFEMKSKEQVIDMLVGTGNALLLKLGIRTQEGYEPQNTIRSFKKIEKVDPTKTAASAPF